MRLSCVCAQAACYGRAFCAADAVPRDAILSVARNLRILNALRAPDVGLPLTLAQVWPRLGNMYFSIALQQGFDEFNTFSFSVLQSNTHAGMSIDAPWYSCACSPDYMLLRLDSLSAAVGDSKAGSTCSQCSPGQCHISQRKSLRRYPRARSWRR